MSGETEQHPSAWTIDSLKEHLTALVHEQDRRNEQRFEAQEKAVQAALAASEKAVSKSEGQAEQHRAAANEWRGAMSDRDRELPSRREMESAVGALSERLTLLEKHQSNQQGNTAGRGAMLAGVGALAAFMATVVILANLFIGAG